MTQWIPVLKMIQREKGKRMVQDNEAVQVVEVQVHDNQSLVKRTRACEDPPPESAGVQLATRTNASRSKTRLRIINVMRRWKEIWWWWWW